jgi:hypothetical protein
VVRVCGQMMLGPEAMPEATVGGHRRRDPAAAAQGGAAGPARDLGSRRPQVGRPAPGHADPYDVPVDRVRGGVRSLRLRAQDTVPLAYPHMLAFPCTWRS